MVLNFEITFLPLNCRGEHEINYYIKAVRVYFESMESCKLSAEEFREVLFFACVAIIFFSLVLNVSVFVKTAGFARTFNGHNIHVCREVCTTSGGKKYESRKFPGDG